VEQSQLTLVGTDPETLPARMQSGTAQIGCPALPAVTATFMPGKLGWIGAGKTHHVADKDIDGPFLTIWIEFGT
jgi:hypothetical protein